MTNSLSLCLGPLTISSCIIVSTGKYFPSMDRKRKNDLIWANSSLHTKRWRKAGNTFENCPVQLSLQPGRVTNTASQWSLLIFPSFIKTSYPSVQEPTHWHKLRGQLPEAENFQHAWFPTCCKEYQERREDMGGGKEKLIWSVGLFLNLSSCSL